MRNFYLASDKSLIAARLIANIIEDSDVYVLSLHWRLVSAIDHCSPIISSSEATIGMTVVQEWRMGDLLQLAVDCPARRSSKNLQKLSKSHMIAPIASMKKTMKTNTRKS